MPQGSSPTLPIEDSLKHTFRNSVTYCISSVGLAAHKLVNKAKAQAYILQNAAGGQIVEVRVIS